MRVLVVSEDVKERLRAVSALMLHSGAEVTESASVDDARRRLVHDGEQYDVLVVDGDLTPRGGYAMLYDLRARAELAGVEPTRALILADREQDQWLTNWAGANGMLLKPVSSLELARRVAEVVDEDIVDYGDSASAAKQVAVATRDHG